MNLKQAMEVSRLSQTTKSQPMVRKTAEDIARRVFELAAQAGRPFENLTHKDWAKRWLASKEFVLMEIPLGKAALPMRPKNQNLVLHKVTAAADEEPIVVDMNKRGIGAAFAGYVPDVIVVDGKHRHVAYTIQGRGRCMAWVGVKAVKSVQEVNPKLDIATSAATKKTNIEKAAILATSVPAQSDSVNNSANHMPMPGMKPDGKVYSGAGMGGPGASLGQGSGANPNRMGFGAIKVDKMLVDKKKKKNMKSGAELNDPSDELNDPSDKSPGSGNGKRTKPNYGGSKSELNMKLKGAKK